MLGGTLFLVWLIRTKRLPPSGGSTTRLFAQGIRLLVQIGLIVFLAALWTLSDRYRAIEVPVTVARGAVPQQVIDVLKRVAANQAGITKEPAPQAYVVNLGSDAISFNLRVWTDQYEDWIQVRSNLAVAVDEALSRANIAVA